MCIVAIPRPVAIPREFQDYWRYPIDLGCTAARHKQIGIDAVVNARAGLQHLNALSNEDIERERDGRAIKDRISRRIRFYGPVSKFFRRHEKRIAHLIATIDDFE